MASYIIRGNPPIVSERLRNVAMTSICISAISQAELLLGIERKPETTRLRDIVREFLLRVEVLPWDSDAAVTYARLRAHCDSLGTPLSSMDMLIAAHATAVGATLITNDKAFYRIRPALKLEDWTLPPE